MTHRKPKTWRAWTQDEEETLAAMLEEGATRVEIAAVLGRSRDSVGNKAGQLGLKGCIDRGEWSREQLDVLVARYRTPGWTAQRIADVTGRSLRSVYGKARELELQNPNIDYKAKPEALEQRLLVMAAQDMTLVEIGEALGVSRNWARDHLKQHPYHWERWKAREGVRRSHGQACRREEEAAA